MLPFKRLSHVSVTVSDLEKARAFYGGLIGLREIPRPPFPFPGVWYALSDIELHITVDDQERPRPTREHFSVKDPHFALRVEDADELARRLAEAGVAHHDVPESPTGFRQLFIKDPDGNMVEFVGPTRTGV